MLRRFVFVSCSLTLAALSLFSGCWFSGGDGYDTVDPDYKLGDLVDPFDPPTLEDLEKTVAGSGGWVDRPVEDGVELMRERQAGEPELVTVDEALKLKNDSDKSNAEILSALGRMPKDAKDVKFDAVVTRATPQQLNHQNPLLASSVTEFDVVSLTGFGLFGFDWNFRPFGSKDAVVSWQTSKDGMYDKVVMRDDLLWSDGTPITAHDIEFSFKVIMTQAVPIRAQRTGTDQLKYVKAYDDQTLVYFHKAPLATNVWNINFSIIPKHIYEETLPYDPNMTDSDAHIELEKKPIVGGGYTVTKKDTTEIVLERRESAYMFEGKQVRDKPNFRSVRLKITPDMSVQLLGLKAGDIDEMMLEANQWTDQTDGDDFYKYNTKARGLEWTSFCFQWNTKSKFFSDEKVRWAMSYAFDHEEMLKTLRKGLDEPCTGIFHPTSRWYPGEKNPVSAQIEPLQMNRDKAKQLLEEAGWKDTDGDGFLDKEGRKFEFSIIVRNQKERIDICELLKENLRVIGIECNVRPMEGATLQDKMFEKQFDAAYGGWGTGADPDTSKNIWGSGESRNFVNYSSEMVDELFEEGKKLQQDRKPWKELKVWQDAETRESLQLDDGLADQKPTREACYGAIHALLWKDQPYTWLFYRNSYHGFNKKLRGYVFSPRGVTGYSPGFSGWWVPADN